MRRNLKIPQFAAVMGMCIAGGAYLPALSDLIVMVEGTSFMGLGGPNLVRGATGETSGAEELGGAKMHTSISGVAHLKATDDRECIEILRGRFRELPVGVESRMVASQSDLYDVLPEDHRQPSFPRRDQFDDLRVVHQASQVADAPGRPRRPTH